MILAQPFIVHSISYLLIFTTVTESIILSSYLHQKMYLGLQVMQVCDKFCMAVLMSYRTCYILPNHSSFITQKAYIQFTSCDSCGVQCNDKRDSV
jgi:hypothetical protein